MRVLPRQRIRKSMRVVVQNMEFIVDGTSNYLYDEIA